MSQTPTVKFRDLRIGQSFDWIQDDSLCNTFYRRCEKTSARGYQDTEGLHYRVGSINAKVYHVDPLMARKGWE